MTPPIVRKRKFHRRSKDGCKKCKSRHVRCDERQPLWYVVQDMHPYHGVCVLDVGGASTLVYFFYQTSDYQQHELPAEWQRLRLSIHSHVEPGGRRCCKSNVSFDHATGFRDAHLGYRPHQVCQ